MTEKRLRELLELWQERLGIGHYDIELEVIAFDDEALPAARVMCSTSYDRAKLQVQPWLLSGKAPPRVRLQGGPRRGPRPRARSHRRAPA